MVIHRKMLKKVFSYKEKKLLENKIVTKKKKKKKLSQKNYIRIKSLLGKKFKKKNQFCQEKNLSEKKNVRKRFVMEFVADFISDKSMLIGLPM